MHGMASRADSVPARRAGTSILVLEDEEPIRRLIGRILGASGVSMRAVDTCHAAHIEVLRQRWDCFITDLRLPDGNGMTVANEFLARYPDAAVIVITGDSDSRMPAPGVRDPRIRAVLRKPFDNTELAKAVSSALAKP